MSDGDAFAGPRVAIRRGFVLLDVGRPDQAADQFKRALATDPDAFDAHLGLSMARRAQGNAAGAIESAKRAVSLRPDVASGLSTLALALRAGEQPSKAVIAAERSVEMAPHDPYPRYVLTECLLGAGDVAGALATAHRCRAIAPDSPSALAAVGRASLEASRGRQGPSATQQRAEARAAFQARVAANPDDVWAHTQLADLEELAGRHDRAIGHLVSAGRVQPEPSLRDRIDGLLRTPRPAVLAMNAGVVAYLVGAVVGVVVANGGVDPIAGVLLASGAPVAVWLLSDRRSRRVERAASLALRRDPRRGAAEGAVVFGAVALMLAGVVALTWPPEREVPPVADEPPTVIPLPALPIPTAPELSLPDLTIPGASLPAPPSPSFTSPPATFPPVTSPPPLEDPNEQTPEEAWRTELFLTLLALVLAGESAAAAVTYAVRWRGGGAPITMSMEAADPPSARG